MSERPRALRWRTALAGAVGLLTYAILSTACIAQDESYLVRAGDVLQITVWKEDGLQQDVLVRPDGGLTFPLAGEIEAAGQQIGKIREAVESRVRKYIPDAIVTVALRASGGSRIFVLGKVNKPGDLQLTQPLDVLQALSLAGGTTPYADVNDIRILRREGTEQSTLHFRYKDVMRGRLEQNILLHSGDTVVVP